MHLWCKGKKHKKCQRLLWTTVIIYADVTQHGVAGTDRCNRTSMWVMLTGTTIQSSAALLSTLFKDTTDTDNSIFTLSMNHQHWRQHTSPRLSSGNVIMECLLRWVFVLRLQSINLLCNSFLSPSTLRDHSLSLSWGYVWQWNCLLNSPSCVLPDFMNWKFHSLLKLMTSHDKRG